MKIKTMPLGSIGTNCYLVWDGESAVCAVIDPGAEGARVAEAVRALGCESPCVLLTHGHYDHTGGVAALAEIWPSLPVYLNSRDVYTGDDRRKGFLFPALPCKTISYDEGDSVEVGALRFSVLATPGHTPGGVSLLCEDVLFSGDTLFCGSMGRTDLSGGSDEQMASSLRRLGNLPGDPAVCPGHMDASTLERERAYNPYLRQAMGSAAR